jgi:endonuclease/exonuclease/phosphatase family metal-dependent hydrolase
MPKLKIATFNVEWMISIFGGVWKAWDGTIPATFPGKSLGGIKLAPIQDVPGLCKRIAGVIKAVDPDILGIEEGPPLKAQMELFVKQHLNNKYAVFQSNEKNQSLFTLVRNSLASKIAHTSHTDVALKLLSGKFPYYPWLGYRKEDRKSHKFDRIPLVLKFKPSAKRELQIIVVHTKSKFSDLKTRQQWENREKGPVLSALDSRQKLSGEVGQLRKYISSELQQPDANKGLLVMGDFNDGPFADLMEQEFLLYNIVDELVGSFLEPKSYLSHAMTPDVLSKAETVRFSDPLEDGAVVGEFIDHILLSPSIIAGDGAFRLQPKSCQVETAVYDQFNNDVNDNNRGLRPSDHRPVSVVIDY